MSFTSKDGVTTNFAGPDLLHSRGHIHHFEDDDTFCMISDRADGTPGLIWLIFLWKYGFPNWVITNIAATPEFPNHQIPGIWILGGDVAPKWSSRLQKLVGLDYFYQNHTATLRLIKVTPPTCRAPVYKAVALRDRECNKSRRNNS